MLVFGATAFFLCEKVGMLASLLEGAGIGAKGVIDGVVEDATKGLPTPVVARAIEG